jgi:hypothetical protein
MPIPLASVPIKELSRVGSLSCRGGTPAISEEKEVQVRLVGMGCCPSQSSGEADARKPRADHTRAFKIFPHDNVRLVLNLADAATVIPAATTTTTTPSTATAAAAAAAATSADVRVLNLSSEAYERPGVECHCIDGTCVSMCVYVHVCACVYVYVYVYACV